MAAAFTRSNGDYLQSKFGRMPSPGELYIAHFLGPQGAEKMFDAGLQDPDQVAAQLFPQPGQANPQIFYDRRPRPDDPRGLQGAGRPAQRHRRADIAPDPAFAAQQIANARVRRQPSARPTGHRRASASRHVVHCTVRTETPTGTPTPLIGSAAGGAAHRQRSRRAVACRTGGRATAACWQSMQQDRADTSRGRSPPSTARCPAQATIADQASALGYSPLPAPPSLLVAPDGDADRPRRQRLHSSPATTDPVPPLTDDGGIPQAAHRDVAASARRQQRVLHPAPRPALNGA